MRRISSRDTTTLLERYHFCIHVPLHATDTAKKAHIPLFLYPFLNTTSKTRPFEYLRLTSLGVIGALVKVGGLCYAVASQYDMSSHLSSLRSPTSAK